MDIAYIPYIEAAIESQIMVGDGKEFNPKGNLTRAEMMQIMENMNEILYDTMNLVSKNGYVGHAETVVDSQGTGSITDVKLWIRSSDGSVDQLIRSSSYDSLKRLTKKDAMVYKNNELVTMDKLSEGDTINYIVNDVTKEVYYIQVLNSNEVYHISGVLEPLSDIGTGKLTIVNSKGYKQSFNLSSSLYNNTNGSILIDDRFISFENAPVTNQITLSVKNQLVTEIDFGGTLLVTDEFSGIVLEHNTSFNYMRVTDWDGNEVVKKYNEGEVSVEKQEYYDQEDQVGYIDQLFPYYRFDEKDTSIDAIEAGDIVHIKLSSTNSENIIAISAKTNYTVKFGEVMTSLYKGDEGYKLTLKLSDNTVISYDVTDSVNVIKGSKNISMLGVESGDVVRILVNEAVVAPGTIKESIKEIMIDANGNVVEKVYKGNLGTINNSQETLSILNSYELLQTGWKNYVTAKTLDISKESINYYYEGEAITIDYANKFLRQDEMDMYVVTENYYNKERVTKVTFRDNRDSVLDYSNVIVTNGLNQIQTQNHEGSITMDSGTIVIKNGKIIAPSNVMAPDYAQVVLNGNNQAAIITVKEEPNNDSISVFRGRIAKINEYEDFTVTSHAVLSQMEWIYSPIERVFEIDYKTVIKDEEDTIDINDFIGYSDATKVDEVYTIIAEGTKASYIIKGPYVKDGVIGEIVDIDTTELTISLKDTISYDQETKQWNELSVTNSYSEASLFNESVIIKNNQVISIDELVVGDKLRILTDLDLADELKLNDSREFSGYIIFVE
jgi:hypothetical protein